MRHQWQLPWAGCVNNAQSQSHTSCSPVNTQANPFPRALICSYLTNSLISTKSSAITLGESAYLYPPSPDPTSDGSGGGSKEKEMDPCHFQSWRHNYLSPHLTFNLLRSVNLPGYLGLLIKARNNSPPHSKLAITPPQKKKKHTQQKVVPFYSARSHSWRPCLCGALHYCMREPRQASKQSTVKKWSNKIGNWSQPRTERKQKEKRVKTHRSLIFSLCDTALFPECNSKEKPACSIRSCQATARENEPNMRTVNPLMTRAIIFTRICTLRAEYSWNKTNLSLKAQIVSVILSVFSRKLSLFSVSVCLYYFCNRDALFGKPSSVWRSFQCGYLSTISQ